MAEKTQEDCDALAETVHAEWSTCPNEMAFPNEPCETGNQEWGLTKREWFAGQALRSLQPGRLALAHGEAAERAKIARELADALIAELNKEPNHD